MDMLHGDCPKSSRHCPPRLRNRRDIERGIGDKKKEPLLAQVHTCNPPIPVETVQPLDCGRIGSLARNHAVRCSLLARKHEKGEKRPRTVNVGYPHETNTTPLAGSSI